MGPSRSVSLAVSLAVCGLAAPGCAPPAEEAFAPTLPPLSAIVGAAPDQRDIPDDVKADGPLPAQYTDLIALQSPVRQQGNRGVCTIFTSTALLEHLAIRRGLASPDFSEQFLQWSEKVERPGAEHEEASDLGQVMQNLAVRGTVAEVLWPYQSKTWLELGHPECAGPENAQPVACFTNGDPPPAALAASREKMPVGRYLRNSAIKSYLYQQKTPVAVGVDVIPSAWSYPPEQYTARPGAWERGEVPYPSPRELADARAQGRIGHAVLIVGWDDDYVVPVVGDDGRPVVGSDGQPVMEKGFYIVKNSWGTSFWGKQNPYGAGYGLVSQRYIAELGTAYVVGMPTGAPPPADGEKHDGGANLAFSPSAPLATAVTVDQAGPAASAVLSIAIAHPSPSQVAVHLQHDNVTWTLWDHNPGTQPPRGNWNLTELTGVDRSGEWTLSVEADPGAAQGTLQSWSITFK